MLSLPRGRIYVCYSRPGPGEKVGEDFDFAGHLSPSVFTEAGVTPESDVYVCGPNRFMADMKTALSTFGVAAERVRIEIFNGSEPMTPGIVGAAKQLHTCPPTTPKAVRW